MANCPSCQSPVDAEADLCLECGEPLGDSPAARIARGESPTPAVRPATPAPSAPVRAAARPQRATIASTPSARRREEEPEAVRCPGCGSPSRAARCPGCGAVLRRD